MDVAGNVENYGGMPAPKRTSTRKLYLSEWLARLSKRPVDLAKHLGVGESYVSNMRSNRKTNPSVDILLAISEFLGITVNDLFKQPPKAIIMTDLQGYSAEAIQQLLAARGRPTDLSR